jgi:hypothetical protein
MQQKAAQQPTQYCTLRQHHDQPLCAQQQTVTSMLQYCCKRTSRYACRPRTEPRQDGPRLSANSGCNHRQGDAQEMMHVYSTRQQGTTAAAESFPLLLTAPAKHNWQQRDAALSLRNIKIPHHAHQAPHVTAHSAATTSLTPLRRPAAGLYSYRCTAHPPPSSAAPVTQSCCRIVAELLLAPKARCCKSC